MKKLEAKTKEQQDYIAALVEEESGDGDVKVCEGGIDYTVDQCFGVGMSFDTMAEIVDYLRNEPVREDLEKEIDLVEDKYRGFESLSRADVIDVAKHFFELGLSVNNPVTAADRCTAEEIIINLKRVEQDYHIDLTKEMEWVRNQVKKGE